MLKVLIKRNVKLFFKDKGMFLTSLITPVILLVLYATFLGNIYRDSFQQGLPEFVKLSEELLDGLVGGQLISSLLAVSCITVAFCSNILMVQDKANGTIKDLSISPVKKSTLALSYYFATLAIPFNSFWIYSREAILAMVCSTLRRVVLSELNSESSQRLVSPSEKYLS